MQVEPDLRRAAACLLIALGAAAASGCEKEDKDDAKSDSTSAPATPPPAAPPPPPPATPPPPPPVAPAAPVSDVTRYPNEQPIGRAAVLANNVDVRKAAKAESPSTQALAKGTPVNQVAQSGNWTLIGWKDAGGDKLGWVESAKAFGAELDSNRKNAVDEARKRGILFPR